MNMEKEKTYFLPGELVIVKHDIPNKPIMYVVRKEEGYRILSHEDDLKVQLMGMRCRWFTADGSMQEDVFNTKDLEHYNNG